MTLFDYLYEDFRFEKDKPIRLFESFAGIGFQRMGLELAEIPYEVVGISEIDKFAIESYGAIHGECPNYGDISKIKGKDLPRIDVFTYSFPCQDLSLAGQGAGLGKGTRSGLVYEVLRIMEELKEIDNLPKVLIMENVTQLVSKKFVGTWNEIQHDIERLGYTNYTQTLNAKNYGIAQNRDRVFMVSILGEYNYNFPRGFELEHRLKDYLEEEVDEKYYLSDKMLNTFTDMTDRNGFVRGDRFKPHDKESEYAYTITTNTGQRATDNFINIPEATKKGYAEAKEGDGVYINRPHQKRGVVQDGMIQTLKTSGNDVGVVVGSYDYRSSDNFMRGKSRLVKDPDVSNTIITSPNVGVAIEKIGNIYPSGGQNGNVFETKGISPTISSGSTSTKGNGGIGSNNAPKVLDSLRIRKLTPVETGRLMGMNDEQINKQLEVVSNSQAYKQHGNGIVAQVIGLIMGMLYYEDEIELRNKVMKNSHTWLK